METKTKRKNSMPMDRTSSSSIENGLFSFSFVSSFILCFFFTLLNEHARDYLSESRYQIWYGYGLVTTPRRWYSLLRWQYPLYATNENSEPSSGRRGKKTIDSIGFYEVCACFRWNDSSPFSALACLRGTPQELFSMHSCRVPTVSAAVARTHYWL